MHSAWLVSVPNPWPALSFKITFRALFKLLNLQLTFLINETQILLTFNTEITLYATNHLVDSLPSILLAILLAYFGDKSSQKEVDIFVSISSKVLSSRGSPLQSSLNTASFLDFRNSSKILMAQLHFWWLGSETQLSWNFWHSTDIIGALSLLETKD